MAIAGAIVAALVLAGLYAYNLQRMQADMKAQQHETDRNTVTAAAQLNEQWATFDTTGKFPPKQDGSAHRYVYGRLVLIREDSPSYGEARRLVDVYAARQVKINEISAQSRKERIIKDTVGRDAFARHLDKTFLERGIDVTVTATGPAKSILKIHYILLNRPLVYQTTNDGEFLRNAWNAGFKKVVFDNGNQTWTYDVPLDWF